MLHTIKKIWLPVLGSGTSLTMSGVENINIDPPQILAATQLLINNPIIYYFLIGLAGAAGGLTLKIVWGIIKRFFPKLKNIDK